MVYKCQICGYIYDEAKENTMFEELPDTWKCPWCGAAKSDFAPVVEAIEKATIQQSSSRAEFNSDLTRLTPGQLATICSNLARGSEKQYMNDAAGLFRQLADYFDSVTPSVQDGTVEKLASMLQDDVDYYKVVRATADENDDRGAARICVWGEKVTRMLVSLLNRYIKEGDQMLAGTNIWVCGVCGFVYIGDEAPELCPVCKVPSNKFEKVEGRNQR